MNMPMIFDEKLAIKYGLEEAVMLQNLMFWVRKNKANGKHFYDGKYWTYNSATAFEKLFPFWNRAKIYRVLESLEKQGAIFCGNYNAVAYDRTRWYAVSDGILNGEWIEKSMFQNRDIHVTDLQHGCAESETPIPDVNSDSKPDINQIALRFCVFWSKYPKKTAKQAAQKAWEKINPDDELLSVMLNALDAQIKQRCALLDAGKFAPEHPYPATWLNGKRWEDELPDQGNQRKTEVTGGLRRMGT